MRKKKVIIYAVVALVVIAGLAYFLVGSTGKPGTVYQQPGDSTTTTTGTPKSTTHASVSADTKIPGVGDQTSGGVGAPITVVPAAPGITALARSFDISVQNDKFTPSTVTVLVGDTVNISITAVDKDYDFTQPDYGLSSPLPKGVKKLILFQGTSSGKYTFFCKSCGGPDKGPVGYIVVVPKQ
jgi:heme/copper-type cytochrome/quinol oxidase subunit 2